MTGVKIKAMLYKLFNNFFFVFDSENTREYDRERQIFKEERENSFGRFKRRRETR